MTVGRRPRTLSRRSAGVCASPTTRGMRTADAVVVVVGAVVVAVVAVVVVVVAVVVEGPLPVETFSVTFEPLSTSWPAAGFCATTVPAGFADGTLCSTGFSPAPVKALTAEPCDCPTTCGTITGFAPLETVKVTVVLRAAVTPATGDCSTTTPFGRDDATRFTAVLVKPAAVKRRRACAT